MWGPSEGPALTARLWQEAEGESWSRCGSAAPGLMGVGGNPGLSGQTPPTRPPGRREARRALVCSISLALRPGQAEPSAALTCVHVWVAKAAARPMPKKTRHQWAGKQQKSGGPRKASTHTRGHVSNL